MLRGKLNFNYFYPACLIVLYPFSVDIFLGTRLLEIILFLFLFASIFIKVSIKENFFIYFFILLILIFINSIFYLLKGFDPELNGFLLFFKILLHVLSFALISSSIKSLSRDEFSSLISLFIFISALIGTWSIFSFSNGTLKQIGYPLSTGLTIDSHTFGSLLTLLFTFFFLMWRKNFTPLKILLISIIFLSIFTTGSRSVIFLLPLLFFSIFFRNFIAGKILRILLTFFLISILLYLFEISNLISQADEIRSLSINLAFGSELNRISRLLFVLNNLGEDFYLFGRGLFFAETLYFDGTITFLLYNFGLIGLIIYIFVLVATFISYIQKGRTETLFLFIALCSLGVSEFFLLSRWFIPVLICYFILVEKRRREALANFRSIKIN